MPEEIDEEVEIITLTFSVIEAARLVEILSFCKSSCQYLSLQESVKGTDKAADKYAAMSEDSGALANYIAQSVSMGEPDPNKVH